MALFRTLSVSLVAVAALLAFSTSAAAQDVQIHAWPTFEPKPADVSQVPENGRLNFPLVINMEVRGDFACPAVVTVAVEIDYLVTFPQWAGSSLVTDAERVAQFEISAGPHQGGVKKMTADGPVLDIVWDMENAPNNHTHTYQVGATKIAAASQGTDCVPSIFNGDYDEGSTSINISKPYYAPPPSEDTGEDPCLIDPFAPGCQAAAPEEAESPGASFVALLAAGAAAVVLRRRR